MRGRAFTVLAVGALVAACAGDGNPDAVESNRGGETTSTGTDPTTPDTTDDTTPSTDDTPSTGDTTGGTTVSTDAAAEALSWAECDPDDVPSTPTELPGTVVPECATLGVPLDHDRPDGEQIELALIRIPASGDREGAVLTNPGGPGGSGFDFVANAGTSLASELGVGDKFDIVGFDPRGVDRSGGLDCVSDQFLDDHLYPDLTPDDAAAQKVLDDSEAAIYSACEEEYGSDLALYSTESTARDMDAIREALGDDQISYLGISYGTYLGAVYATLFPDNVRAMVLDSSFEPTGDTVEQQYTTQLEGFEKAFGNWAAWCAENDACAFTATDGDAVGERWDELFDRLDAEPLTADGGRAVNQSTMFNATIAAMYSETSWPDLAASLALAEDGDPHGILRLADGITGRNPDGTYQNIAESGPVIRCASGIVQDDPDDPEALLEELRAVAPRFSLDTRVEDLRDLCSLMLPERADAVVPSYDGDAPILVTGGTNDPATPFRWAEELEAAMGDSAVLVTFTGEGHGQVLSSKCITELEGAVLADLELPDEGAECEADPTIERPAWWDDVGTPEGVSEPEPLPSLLAAFGLSPSQGYGEVRLTERGWEDVQAGYENELDGGDFTKVTETEILADVHAAYYSTPDDLFLLVLVVPPEAFEGKELESAKGIVPDGKTAVLLVALAV